MKAELRIELIVGETTVFKDVFYFDVSDFKILKKRGKGKGKRDHSPKPKI